MKNGSPGNYLTAWKVIKNESKMKLNENFLFLYKQLPTEKVSCEYFHKYNHKMPFVNIFTNFFLTFTKNLFRIFAV